VHELEGRYYKARETYQVLMVKLNDVEDDANATWDPEPEPSELEKDLWEVKFISYMWQRRTLLVGGMDEDGLITTGRDGCK